MPLPEETRLYMGQHQIGSAPEYRMDRSGNLYMYLERLNAAVEAEGVFACDAGGHPPVFSAVSPPTMPQQKVARYSIPMKKPLRDLKIHSY